jgi:hypothetical protein
MRNIHKKVDREDTDIRCMLMGRIMEKALTENDPPWWVS